MDHWASLFLCSLQDSGVKVWAFMKYVNDVNIVLDIIGMGWRWMDSCLHWKEDWWVEDQESDQSDEERTIELIKSAAESIVSWLSFTVDLPSMHESGKVPMLDLGVWVEKTHSSGTSMRSLVRPPGS